MSKLPVNFSAFVINTHLKAACVLASALLSGLVCPGPGHCCLLLGFFRELPNWSPSFYIPLNCQFSTHHWQVLLKYHFTHNNPLLTLVQCLSFSLKPLPGPIESILTSTCHFFGFPSWVSSISSVQSLSPVRFFVAPWDAAHQASLSITNSQSLLKLTFIESVMPSNHLILCGSSCLQPYPASGSFLMSQFFESGGQRIIASASASVLPMSTQDWSPLGCTGWVSLQSKGLSRLPQHRS